MLKILKMNIKEEEEEIDINKWNKLEKEKF